MINVKLFILILTSAWVLVTPLLVSAAQVAEWRMDGLAWDGSEGEVVDSISGLNGQARTGGASGSLPDTEAGIVCRAGFFRGEGFNVPEQNNAYIQARHYIEIPDADALSPLASTETMSLSGWVRADSGADLTILHKGQGGASQEYQVAVNGGKLEATFWDIYGSGGTVRIDSSEMSAGNWYFFGVATEPVGNSGQIRVYLYLYNAAGTLIGQNDGQFKDFFRVQGGRQTYSSKPLNGPLLIGAERFGAGAVPVNYFDGALDELRVHNETLTSANFEALLSIRRECSEEESGLDHIRLVLPGPGLTCRSSNIEVLACGNADCTTVYADPVE